MKKLYIIEIDLPMVVFAEDDEEAAEIGRASFHEHLSMGGTDLGSPHQLHAHNHIPYDWRGAHPFGGDGSKTCTQIMEEIQAEEKKSEGLKEGK